MTEQLQRLATLWYQRRMSRRGRRWALTTYSLLAALFLGPRPSAGAPAEPLVRYADDRLTVRLENIERRSMLEHLATATGAEVRGSVPAEGTVTAHFDRLPMQDALERLLGKGSFALRYARDGRLKAIELLGEGRPATIVAAPPPLSSPAMFDRPFADAQIPVDGALARLLGPTATFRQLGDVAVNNPDAQMRRDALDRLLRAIDADPQLQEAVEETISSYDDATILNYARAVGGVRADELLSQVSRHGKGNLAARARATLRKLRAEQRAP